MLAFYHGSWRAPKHHANGRAEALQHNAGSGVRVWFCLRIVSRTIISGENSNCAATE